MNLIDWKKVYENAKKLNYDDFLASVQKMEKVDDLPVVQKFSTYMGRYESEIIPKLLENIPNITPAQFVFAACSEVKKNPKLQQAFQENPSSMFASILAAAEIGLKLTLPALASSNITQSTGSGAALLNSAPVYVLAPGYMEAVIATGNTTGYVKWSLWYVPIDEGAYVTV